MILLIVATNIILYHFLFFRGNKSKAAIGFDYDEGVGVAGPSSQVEDDEEDINSDDEYSELINY